ncbi:MAG: hypothetical protein AB2531_12895 [Candidatus Thiodiazotropha sp.]
MRTKNLLMVFGIVMSVTGLVFSYYPIRMESRLKADLQIVGDCAFFIRIVLQLLSPLVLLKSEELDLAQEKENAKMATDAAEKRPL